MVRYLLQHWRGEVGLAWSFWVNLVLVRAAITIAQDAAAPMAIPLASDYQSAAVVIAAVLHVAVLIWQVVGVVRSGERHMREGGEAGIAWGAYFGCLMAMSLAAVSLLGAWQMTLAVTEENFVERMDREHASKYRLEISTDGEEIQLNGEIALGVTKRFAALLTRYPSARRVVLESGGGNIYEARGLAKRIRDRRLEAVVRGRCASACTIVFIAGVRRTIAADARLGFHRYRTDANYRVLVTNPAEEQARDRALFAASGVAPWFLAKMYDADVSGMWWPSREELVRAGVVRKSPS